MKSTEDEPSGDPSTGKYFFSTPMEMEALFAGCFQQNLRKMGNSLGVKAVVRDLRLQLVAAEPVKAERVFAFLKRLEKLRLESPSKRVDQQDFDQLLAAFQNSTENELQNYFSQRIKVSPRKKEIVPRTANQLAYVKAVREHDAETVRREAHAIKGGAANLTATQVQELASQLEVQGKAGRLTETEEILERLEKALYNLKKCIEGIG